MTDGTFRIIIVGGGTAGWLSAAFLSQQLPAVTTKKIHITLVEASDIPTVGVGEATVPSIRQTLAACGISELDFMKSCDATFKHGIKFQNWRQNPHDHPNESYFHPFGEPLKVGGTDPMRLWAKLEPKHRGNIADIFSVQSEIAQMGRAPKHLKDRPYDGALSYAYHLDAGKLAEFLKRRFRGQSVEHVIGKITKVNVVDRSNTITHVDLEDGSSLEADFFIDCTGFAARLINHDKKNTFDDKTDILFVDRAVTTRLPTKGISEINGYTTCTAQTNGWIWDIVLQKRRGIGHVYSSRHTDDDTARTELAAYVGASAEDMDVRQLAMRIGYHKKQWRENCVAIGLSSGFLEPLESTGIYLTEMANWALLDLLPRFIEGASPQEQFTETMAHHYENIVDFLKLHYALNQRGDSDFWRENADPETWTDTLKSYLEAWKNDVPSVYDFGRSIQCFSANNYRFVLFGMGWPGHDTPVKDSENTQNLMKELTRRRNRLRDFVLRDTLPNSDIYRDII